MSFSSARVQQNDDGIKLEQLQRMGKVATTKGSQVDSHPLLRIVLSKIIVFFHQSAIEGFLRKVGTASRNGQLMPISTPS